MQLSELLLLSDDDDSVELFSVVVDEQVDPRLVVDDMELSLNWLIRPMLWVPPIDVSTTSGSNLT